MGSSIHLLTLYPYLQAQPLKQTVPSVSKGPFLCIFSSHRHSRVVTLPVTHTGQPPVTHIQSAPDCKHTTCTSSGDAASGNLIWAPLPKTLSWPISTHPDNGAPESRVLFPAPSPCVITTNTEARLVREGLQIPRSEATVS